MKIPLGVRAVGAVCSVGDGALECSTSVRARIQRVTETSFRSRGGAACRMGMVPEETLGELWMEALGPRTTAYRRALRLARCAITEAGDACGGGALPVSLVTRGDEQGSALLDDLSLLLGPRIERAASRQFAIGSAGVFVALLDAAHRVADGEAAVMVVAADSPYDPGRLDALQRSRRLLTDDVTDGFIPGEGAAALVVTAATPGSLAVIARVGVEHDGFHPDGDAALTGDGLTAAVHAAMDGSAAPARGVWASLNGESWTAKEWGLAARRAHRAIDADARVEHPAECFGDTGAALGAMLLVLATVAMHRRQNDGPLLVWSASEEGFRGAARVERAASQGGA